MEAYREHYGTQNVLICLLKECMNNLDQNKIIGAILFDLSKGLPDESMKPPSTSTNILNPLLNYAGTKIRVEFKGSCLKQDEISFHHGKMVNTYIIYQTDKTFDVSSYPALENCFFGAVKLTKHSDIDQ